MNSLTGKKVLITCGPTWIPIDDPRVISNISSGELGQTLAEKLNKNGAKVTLLEGPVRKPLENKSINIIKFVYFDDLLKRLNKAFLKPFDIVIHAAAVSDYEMQKTHKTKLSSDLNTPELKLKRTPKIIECIKKLNPNIFLVGFKLTSRLTKTSAFKDASYLFAKSKCDLVVANSMAGNKYKGFVINSNNDILGEAQTKSGIVNALVKQLKTSSF